MSNTAGTDEGIIVTIVFGVATDAQVVSDLDLAVYIPAPVTGGIPAGSLAGPQYTGG